MTSVVVIVAVFFVIGITVGIVTVVALAALRQDRRSVPGGWPEYGARRPGEQPPDPRWDDGLDVERPWWHEREGE
jgi:hypothetical protein